MTRIASLAAAALVAGGLGLASFAAPALAAGKSEPPPILSWSFSGPFGHFDRAQLQRGFKVYKEGCMACHGLSKLSFRNLSQAGGPEFTEAQVLALAAEWPLKVKDINDAGDAIERTPRPADRFPAPFANEAQARAANGGAYPPDLSVMAKARTYERGFPWWILDVFWQYQENGVDYLAALLKGYEDAPAGVTVPDGSNYNKYFPGNFIGMPQPLQDGQIDYTDGSPQTLVQYSKDVTAFLMWAAEPHLETRKRMGLQVMIFLVVFAGLLYFTKKKVWSNVEGHA